jgi:2,4-dienoyl-CoA reductase-like NADH-dependent reductase (Old Yellow Enzyme family)
MSAEGLQIYERLARGGVGLTITGHMVAAPGGDVHANQTHIDHARFIEAARNIAVTVHRHGPACKVVAQLSHGGPNACVDPIAPSDVGARGDGRKPRVLSSREIEDVVARFAASIARAREAGFDAAEIHGAHGFLLNSFLRSATRSTHRSWCSAATRRRRRRPGSRRIVTWPRAAAASGA